MLSKIKYYIFKLGKHLLTSKFQLPLMLARPWFTGRIHQLRLWRIRVGKGESKILISVQNGSVLVGIFTDRPKLIRTQKLKRTQKTLRIAPN